MSKEAREKLKQRPVLVLFYMDGCRHCQANQPAWEEAKEKMKGKMKVAEIEAKETPPEEDVSSFPTMMVIRKNGEKKSISGTKKSGGEILKGLKLRNEGGSRVRRRHTRGRATRGRNRKLRHRTLRNHVALV